MDPSHPASRTDARRPLARLIGESAPMRTVRSLIEQGAPSDAPVLITGESGTGKELVARILHELSGRAHRPFLAINCAAIPEALLETELFGHERGAFTGAVGRQAGCFELAHEGTLLLDEVAEMAPATQAKLLRVLQERAFRRLGSTEEQPVDVRVVATTNLDLEAAMGSGQLREDLFYRLNVLAIEMPALRHRAEDIGPLARAFLAELAAKSARPVRRLAPDAMRALERYGWPGNVRELRNVLERAVILARDGDDQLTLEHLSPDIHARPAGSAGAVERLELAPGMTVDEAERRLIEITLRYTGNNKTRAARLLGISAKTLHSKLRRYRNSPRPLPPSSPSSAGGLDADRLSDASRPEQSID